MDDDWDDLHGEIVDLDGYGEATGDPQLDVYGYQSPKRRGGTGFTSSQPDRDWLAQAKADRAQRQQRRREAVQQNLEQTRQRVEQRRGKTVADRPQSPQPVQPDLPPHVSAAVAQGMAGRDLGWWKVVVDAYGRAVWTRVDAPGDGPQVTVQQSPEAHPVELTEPGPGTVVY
jgi:hypothetical protein